MGSLCKNLSAVLEGADIELVTTVHKNMKDRMILALDRIIISKRDIIEL